jgi:hypothetical protein
LIGYVALGVGYLTILSVQVIGVFVLPDLAATQPGYVNDVLAVATSGTPVGDVGRMQILSGRISTDPSPLRPDAESGGASPGDWVSRSWSRRPVD